MKNKNITDYPYKIEFHAHSYPASCDSLLTTKQLLDNLKKNNYSGVVLSNHFDNHQLLKYNIYNCKEEKIYELCKGECGNCFIKKDIINLKVEKNNYCDWLNDIKQAKIYGEKIGIKVYVGCEYTLSHAHVGLIGLTIEELESDILLPEQNDEYLMDYKKRHPNMIIIQNHVNRDWDILREKPLIDGYESINSKTIPQDKINILPFIKDKLGSDYENYIYITGGDIHQEKHLNKESVNFTYLPENEQELSYILKYKKDSYITLYNTQVL